MGPTSLETITSNSLQNGESKAHSFVPEHFSAVTLRRKLNQNWVIEFKASKHNPYCADLIKFFSIPVLNAENYVTKDYRNNFNLEFIWEPVLKNIFSRNARPQLHH